MQSIVFAVLITVCLAAEPQPCCIMETYSAVLMSVSGAMTVGSTRGQMADDMMEMHYDYNRSMVVSVSHQRNPVTGVRGNLKVIYDYNTNKQHILPEPGMCYTQHLDPNSLPPPCMASTKHLCLAEPDRTEQYTDDKPYRQSLTRKNLTYSGSYSVGSGLKPVKINSFTGQFGPYKATLSVSDKDCTPFAYSQYGSNGKTESLQSFLFTNIKSGVTDNSLFTVPPECTYSASFTGKRSLDKPTLEFQRTPFYIFSHQCMMYGF